MAEQDHFWSRAASYYEQEFIDPYRAGVRANPVKRILRRLASQGHQVVADLGCGIGPLLPLLARRYRKVYAVDFAEGMLDRARERAKAFTNIEYVQASFMSLPEFPEPIDVAVAVNSLVMPRPEHLDGALQGIRRCLKPTGIFLGILPAMDAVHYYTMLLVERALRAGLPLDMARSSAATHCEHKSYDFALGQYRFRGLEQHFWQPFEAQYRFPLAGFKLRKLKKVFLAWQQFAGWKELRENPPPWDWFFLATCDNSFSARVAPRES